MVLRYTEEELALAAIFEPYIENGKPQEVIEALERYDALIEESYR